MYTSTSKKINNNGQTNWFKYYFHRYWRYFVECIKNLNKFETDFNVAKRGLIIRCRLCRINEMILNLKFLNPGGGGGGGLYVRTD